MVMSASLNGPAADDENDQNEGGERRLMMFSRTCSGTTLQPFTYAVYVCHALDLFVALVRSRAIGHAPTRGLYVLAFDLFVALRPCADSLDPFR
eukprot:1848616-Pleurochrysis_carterae.AAC.1